MSACVPLRAQCLRLLPFRLVGGGARMVPALHCLLGGWQFDWLVFLWLDMLPFQLVDGGPCLVPAGCAALSARGRRAPSACLARLPVGGWIALLACLPNVLVCPTLLLFGEGAVPAWCLCALLAWRQNLLPLRLVGDGDRLVPNWRCLLGGWGCCLFGRRRGW